MKRIYNNSVIMHYKDLDDVKRLFCIKKPFGICEVWADENDVIHIIEHYNWLARFIVSPIMYIPNIILGGINEATEELVKVWRGDIPFQTYEIWHDNPAYKPIITKYKSKLRSTNATG